VLFTGIAWRHLPPELGFGGGSTCHRRMDEWQRAGVWERLHELLPLVERVPPRRHPRGLPRDRVLPCLLQETADVCEGSLNRARVAPEPN
jgi:Putative transposase of IS4/5 family (DUF4096)